MVSGWFDPSKNPQDLPVSAIPVADTKLVYTGAELFGFVSTNGAVFVSGHLTGTNAGRYSARFTPEKEMWDDELTGQKSIEFTIAAATITGVSVAQTGELKYTGEALTPTVTATATTVDGCAYQFHYALSEGTPLNQYVTEVPTVVSAGVHTNWYFVSAKNHKSTEKAYFVITVLPPTCMVDGRPYDSVAEAIAALDEPKDDHLGKIEVLDPTAACPAGYYVDGTSVKQYLTVSYLDEKGDERSTNVCRAVSADTSTFEDGGWYVVTGTVTRSTGITVNGSAHLILADGAYLAVTGTTGKAGIEVDNGNEFSVYGQTLGTGELLAQGGGGLIGGAGIGGGGGTITINGGTVTATGAVTGAGIGGGFDAAGGTTTINGGVVTAIGGDNAGAGIGGGGGFNGAGGTITINGGTVTATGGGRVGGAGIGSGGSGSSGGGGSGGGTIAINGGTVTATGGVNPDGYAGAGIGGGVNCAGGDVTITGGKVTATGGSADRPGIGSGKDGNADPGTLKVTGAGMAVYAGASSPDGKLEIGGDGSVAANASRYYAVGIPTEYLDENGALKERIDCTEVTAETATFEDGKWYVVKGTVTRSSGITVNGSAHLILADGAYLAVTGTSANAGIDVRASGAVTNALAVYGQTQGTGELLAQGGSRGGDGGAGIGGGYDKDGGTITINGGAVTATGGKNGAGIGGGKSGVGGTITVNGGTVTAAGTGGGAGIGGGSKGVGGTITVNGGTVTATSTNSGAGIGGGTQGAGGTITINGGAVTAQGGVVEGACIGGGGNSGAGGVITINGGIVTVPGRADNGIGCSEDGVGGTITINGGTVTATGGPAWAGIGGNGGTVTITGGEVAATGGLVLVNGRAGAGIGGGYNYAGCDVILTGGKVTATGGSADRPGIGSGKDGNADPGTLKVTSDGLYVWASANTPPEFVLNLDGKAADLTSKLAGQRYFVINDTPPTCIVDGKAYDTVADAIAAVEADPDKTIADITDILEGAEIPDTVYLENGALYYRPVATITVAKQRWPWNGKIDVAIAATKLTADKSYVLKLKLIEGSATNVYTTAITDLTGVTETNLAVVVDTDSAAGWDAQPAAKEYTTPKLQAVLTVVPTEPEYVQLWKEGPYWATRNLGAEKSTDYGYYYWWGDTVGYKRNAANNGWEAVSGGASFSFSSDNCPTFGKDNATLLSEGYIDSLGNLVAAYDVATVALGAPWRMPTDAEIQALVDNCDRAWTNINGVSGYMVTGKTEGYTDKSIFLPAAGGGYGPDLVRSGSFGLCWSSTPYSDYSHYAWFLYFYSGYFSLYNNFDRYYGQSVRPVRGSAEGDDGAAAAAVAVEYAGEAVAITLDTRAEKTLVKTADDGFASAPLTFSRTAWGAANDSDPLITFAGPYTSDISGEYAGDSKSFAPAVLGSYVFTHTPGDGITATLTWIEKTGVLVDGVDIGTKLAGTGWTYDGNALVVSGPGAAFDKSGDLSADDFDDFLAEKFVSEPAETYVLSRTATGYTPVTSADQIACIDGTYYDNLDDAAAAAKAMDGATLIEVEENWFIVGLEFYGSLTAAIPGGRVVLVNDVPLTGRADLNGLRILSMLGAKLVITGDFEIVDSAGGALLDAELDLAEAGLLSIKGGSFRFDPTPYVSAEAGYTVLKGEDEGGDLWTVNYNAAIGELQEKYGDVADIGFEPGQSGEPDKITIKFTDDFVQLDLSVTNDDTEVVVDLNGHEITADPGSDEGYAIRIAKGTKARITDSQGDGCVSGERTIGEADFDEVTYPASIVVEGELVIEGGVYDGAVDVAKGAELEIVGGKFKNVSLKEWAVDRPMVGNEFLGNVFLAPGKDWQQGADGYWTLADGMVFELDGVETTLEALVAKLATETSTGSEAKPVRLLRDLRLDEPLKVLPTGMFFLDLNGSALSCAKEVVVADPGSFFLCDSAGGGRIDGLVDDTGYFQLRGGRFLDATVAENWDCVFGKRAVRDNEGYWMLADPVDPAKASKDTYERLEDELIPLPAYYGPFIPGVPVAFTNPDLIGCKASGLTFGIVFDKTTGAFSGSATNAGVYKVTFTKTVKDAATKAGVKHTATVTFLVDSLRRVTVVTAGSGGGTVTPSSAAVKKGDKVKLVAKANSKSVFVGWYRDARRLSQSTTYTYTATKAADQQVIAFFSLKKYDAAPILRVGDMKSGKDISERVALGEVVEVYKGVPLKYDLKVNALSKAKITSVKNLPKGLKYNSKTGVISGTPVKRQCITAAITVKNASGVSTRTGIAFNVVLLPDWAKRSYAGVYGVKAASPGAGEQALGRIDFTVKPDGKISGKILAKNRTYVFSRKNYSKYDAAGRKYVFTVTPKDSKGRSLEKVRIEISEGENGFGSFYGKFAKDKNGSQRFVTGAQVPWSRKDNVKYDLPVLPADGLALKLRNGLKAKFGGKGVVTLSGKLPGKDGAKVKVSASAQIVFVPGDDCNAAMTVYVPKSAGLAADFCEVVYLVVTVDDDGVVTGIREKR